MKNYRLSAYTVVTDMINEDESNPRHIIYSTRSGRAAVISGKIIDAINMKRFEDIPEKMILDLFSMDMIVPDDEVEFERVMEQNRIHLLDDKILSVTMQPGANCQLGCHYCGQKHAKHYMNEGLYKKVIDRIENNIKSSPKKYEVLSISWYGAEPLMAFKQIRDMSPMFIDLAERNNIGYMSNMITNGLSLKENIFTELVKDCNVKHFQITIDGTKEHHDTRRITKTGESTYDIIFENILKCTSLPLYKQEKCTVVVRMNIDKTNYESIIPFLHILASHNLQNKVILQFSPIVDWGENKASQNSLPKDNFSEVEIDWYMEALKLGFTNTDLIPARSYGPCMVVNEEAEVFDAYGNIFPCYEMPYTEEFQNDKYMIGNLKFDEKTYNKNVFTRDWFNDVVQGKSTCRECTFFPVCGGGCPKQWLTGTPACPPFKFNMEDRLVLQYITDNKKLTELV